MIQRGGEVVIQMLENVKQRTIFPLIQATIASGTMVYTDEYDIYNRLQEWGYEHKTVCVIAKANMHVMRTAMGSMKSSE